MKWWCETMSKYGPSLNDKAWEILFEKYNILENIEKYGHFEISSKAINEVREARLMAKFDHTINLPKIFVKHKLSILPITRGDYVIAKFDAYHKFEDSTSEITNYSLPNYIQSLDSNNIPSEAIALNCAIAAGIIEDFLEDDKLVSTVSGRMGSGVFNFNIDNVNDNDNTSSTITVTNSQIEIDAAYEGINSLALFEAKRDISEDFLVRQLYYPYRVWQSRVSKPVRPLFLVYSNGIYRLYEYEFKDPNNYSSIHLVKQKNYTIEDNTITASDIQNILNSIKFEEEPKLPFPQADSIERVINLCELLFNEELSKDNITEEYAFNSRQSDYYTNAGRYLGIVDKPDKDRKSTYCLTDRGTSILKLNFKKRQLALCECILKHEVFSKVLSSYFQNGTMPSKDKIVEFMKESHLYNISKDKTYYRRASTIIHWINWIVGLIND